MKNRIYQMEYDNLISNEQGYHLLRLYDEGFDITPALKGRISGIHRAIRMEQYMRSGDLEGVNKLIEETRLEEEEFQRRCEEHMRKLEEHKKRVSAQF